LDGVAGGYAGWVWLTILSMTAIMFLPRQFQVAVIENLDEKHLSKALWVFPLYMLAINIFVLPIAFAGSLHFPGGGVDADTFVLTLPMAHRQEALALLVFIGGLSAATGMVIVETIALSTMVCNDLVMPVLLRLRTLRLNERADLTDLLRPVALLGLTGLDPVAHALLWSMIANVGCYIGVSLFTRQDAGELRQASLFVDVFARGAERAPPWRGSADVASLRALLARFLGPAEADQILADHARGRGPGAESIEADAALVHHVERKLAGALGGASARIMIASVATEEAHSPDEVRAMLDEASQIVVYSHRLEQK